MMSTCRGSHSHNVDVSWWSQSWCRRVVVVTVVMLTCRGGHSRDVDVSWWSQSCMLTCRGGHSRDVDVSWWSADTVLMSTCRGGHSRDVDVSWWSQSWCWRVVVVSSHSRDVDVSWWSAVTVVMSTCRGGQQSQSWCRRFVVVSLLPLTSTQLPLTTWYCVDWCNRDAPRSALIAAFSLLPLTSLPSDHVVLCWLVQQSAPRSALSPPLSSQVQFNLTTTCWLVEWNVPRVDRWNRTFHVLTGGTERSTCWPLSPDSFLTSFPSDHGGTVLTGVEVESRKQSSVTPEEL